MRFRWRTFLNLIIFSIMIINASAQLATTHTIQLAAFETLAEAQAEQQKFLQLGYSPVAVAKVDYWYKVFFGCFEYYVDAYLYKEDIRKKGLSECFIVPTYRITLPDGFGEIPTVGPLEKVLKTPVDKITALPDYSLEADVRYQELERLMNQAPTGEAYRTRLNWYFTNHQQADVFRGYLLTRKGVLALLDKQYDEALNYFYHVVEGRVPARRLDVIKSAKRIAWILHQQGDRPRAWQAYKEIERFTASDLVRAQSVVERAGIIFELYSAEKANYNEVEKFIENAQKNLPEQFCKQHALLLILKIEHYYKRNIKKKEALDLCEIIFSRYKDNMDCQREYAMALCHAGWISLLLEDINKSNEYFNKVLTEINPNVESFAGYNFFAEAKLGLAAIEAAKGNIYEANNLINNVFKNYPNTAQAKKTREENFQNLLKFLYNKYLEELK